MLTNIQAIPATSPPAQEDAVTMLVGCHQRIRNFTDVALRLAWSTEAPPQQLADAAESVLRYYTVALPLHEADENESLYMRLRDANPPADILAADNAMLQQHAEIDDVIALLVPLWQSVQRDPASMQTFALPLLARTERLNELWQTHLKLEEEIIFPALRQYLSDAELAAIAAEMHARRER